VRGGGGSGGQRIDDRNFSAGCAIIEVPLVGHDVRAADGEGGGGGAGGRNGHAADGRAAGNNRAHIDAVGACADGGSRTRTKAEFAGIGLAQGKEGSGRRGGGGGGDGGGGGGFRGGGGRCGGRIGGGVCCRSRG